MTSGPSKHNVLCQGKSALEVIEAHADFAKPKQISAGNIDPIFEVVREPDQQYVLVMETSSSMDNQGKLTLEIFLISLTIHFVSLLVNEKDIMLDVWTSSVLKLLHSINVVLLLVQ